MVSYWLLLIFLYDQESACGLAPTTSNPHIPDLHVFITSLSRLHRVFRIFVASFRVLMSFTTFITLQSLICNVFAMVLTCTF